MMVAILNGSACALTSLSRKFAVTADRVVKASTADYEGQRFAEAPTDPQPAAQPEIREENVFSSAPNAEPEIDLGQEIVHLDTTQTYYLANLRMAATEDELLGTVLDILA